MFFDVDFIPVYLRTDGLFLNLKVKAEYIHSGFVDNAWLFHVPSSIP